MRLGKHIEKNTDNWYVKSKKKLSASVCHKMKRIYVGILEILDREKADGKIDDKTFRRLRSEVLNIGNDQVRRVKAELEESYNIEYLNYHIQFKVIGVDKIDGRRIDEER